MADIKAEVKVTLDLSEFDKGMEHVRKQLASLRADLWWIRLVKWMLGLIG